MTTNEKNIIRNGLEQYCTLRGSANLVSKEIGISGATITHILNEKWDNIAFKMWQKVAFAIDCDYTEELIIAETRPYKKMVHLLTDARNHSLCLGIKGEAGCGKTTTIRDFARKTPNVYRLECKSHWQPKYLITNLLKKVDPRAKTTGTICTLVDRIGQGLENKTKPVITWDEADKLSNANLFMFISFYNDFYKIASLIMTGTQALEDRIIEGADMNRRGFKEIRSRLGNFIGLPVPNSEDIELKCMLNGITDRATIAHIEKNCRCDLRQVDKMIFAHQRKRALLTAI